jgi:hypothetical protein
MKLCLNVTNAGLLIKIKELTGLSFSQVLYNALTSYLNSLLGCQVQTYKVLDVYYDPQNQKTEKFSEAA